LAPRACKKSGRSKNYFLQGCVIKSKSASRAAGNAILSFLQSFFGSQATRGAPAALFLPLSVIESAVGLFLCPPQLWTRVLKDTFGTIYSSQEENHCKWVVVGFGASPAFASIIIIS
jgi:hypothetical protein